uniref:Pc294, similar to antigen 5-related n=1 Tax=Panstrongylus chinai TaxID=156444 RepID=A0A286P0X9_9HEMI|nr:Pc294, similar to antigen 5-related [Panstrongylus chinai]
MANTHYSLVFSLLTLALIDSLVASTQLACKNSNILLGLKTITKKDKQKLLDAHNRYRNLVASGKSPRQPPAQNMRVLVNHVIRLSGFPDFILEGKLFWI